MIYRSIFALLSSYGILLLANGLFGTIISIYAKTAHFSESVIGLIWAGYFLGLLLSPFTSVRLIATIGHIRAFATFASMASVVAVAHLLWVNPSFWGVLRVISGICMGGMIVATEGWLNERASNKNRGTILSVYMITTYACSGGAQLMLMLGGESGGSKLFLIVSILFSFALMPILMSQSQAPSPSMPKRPDLKKLFEISPVGMIGSFVVGFINGIYYSFAPIYAYGIGLDLKETAIFVGLGTASGMLLQLPLGKISDRIDRRFVIAFSATMTAIACYLLYHYQAGGVSVYVLAIFYGSVAFSMNAICVAHTNDLTPPEERTQTSSGLLIMYGIGAILGPSIAGVILSHLAVQSLFAISGFAALGFMIYIVSRLIIKPRKAQEKIRFVPYAIQSPARRLGLLRKRK